VVGERAYHLGGHGPVRVAGHHRGPGGPPGAGAARVGADPGRESCSRAAAFGTGMALDVMPACPGLAVAADAAAGPDDC
jgi:hypothetical protein